MGIQMTTFSRTERLALIGLTNLLLGACDMFDGYQRGSERPEDSRFSAHRFALARAR